MITTCRSDHHPPIHVLHTLLPAVALVPRAAWALCGNSSARRSEIIRESARESTSDTTIRAHSESLGHVPIIDVNPRNNSAAFKQELKQEAKARRALGQVYAKEVRYRERSTVERVNGRLKDEFGARQVRVRGHSKVLCHLMFGVLALTVDQLLRLVN